jgi:hypothetical protein
MTTNQIEMLLAGVFVAVHAYDRFNTPESNRASTTALRYCVGAAAYVGLSLVSFLILSRFPELLDMLGADSLVNQLKHLSRGFLTALVLTVFVEKVPVLSSLDRWLRRELQHMSRIPHEARRLARWLHQASFAVPEPFKLQHRLVSEGFHGDDVTLKDDGSVKFGWLRVEALMDGLKTWEGEHRFSAFMSAYVDEYERLKAQHVRLRAKAIRRFSFERELREESDQRFETVTGFGTEFREQVDELFGSLCEFISRGVLRSRVAGSARSGDLRRLGFTDAPSETKPWRNLSANQLASLFVVTACVLAFGILIAGTTQQYTFGQQVLLVMMIATSYCGAICCALYPKQRWARARRSAHERPVVAYLLSGAVAASLGMVVNFVFKCAMFVFDDDPINKALVNALKAYPWGVLTFTLAASTAFAADNAMHEDGHRKQRLLESAGQAVAMALAGLFAALWLQRMRGPELDLRILTNVALLSALNGAVIGYVVPTWYREAQRRGLGGPVEQEAPPLMVIEPRTGTN